MPHHYYDEKKKKKNGNGLSFKDALEASQTPAGKELTKPKPKKSNGGVDAKGALEAGIALSKSLANASNAKKFRDAGVSALLGKEVSANEKLSDSMDITSFHNAYGSRNVDTTGEDMGQMDPEKRKKKYGF